VTRYLIPVLFLVALAASLAWRVQQVQIKAAEQERTRSAARGRATTVQVAEVARRDLVTEVEELATIRAPLNVNVAAKVSGRLDFLKGYEGDAVRAGEVLVRLDRSELAAQAAEQRAALSAAQARLRQARVGVGPQSAQVKAAIEQAEAELDAARASLRQAEVSAESRCATARHELAEATARLNDAKLRLGRQEALLEKGYVAAQEVDTARTAVAVAQTEVSSAEERVKLMAAEVKADLDVARENVKRAFARLKVARVDRAQDRMYQEYVASQEAAVTQARGALANAQAELSQTEVRSPIDGFVTARHMDPGAMVTPGQPILTLVEIRRVWAEVALSEEQAGHLRRGDTASIRLDAFPNASFTGRIVQINPAANLQSRSFTIRLELENPGLRLKPGMFGRARFVVGRRPGALVVPREAVVKAPTGEAHVFVVAGEVARQTPVQLGLHQGPWIEIREGLVAGQQVVTLGHDRLKDGAPVKVGEAGA
jgi:RND family efflux transporter MFP subunit